MRTDRSRVTVLEDLPNVGPAIAADFRRLGIRTPAALKGRDPYALYAALNRVTGRRHDPCVLDTFIAVVRFVDGAPARPWWHHTAERKETLAECSNTDTRTDTHDPAAGRAKSSPGNTSIPRS
jgi:hypothetical protein